MAAVTVPLTRAERRLAIAASLALFGILCAQSLLETARDALFLTHLPIARLPWMYLAMAALTVVITRLSPTAGRGGLSRAVPASTLGGALITAALAVSLTWSDGAAVYLLFLWSGIFAAFTVTQVWTALAEALDMSVAKRLYARLAAGGGLGALAGAAVARVLSGHVAPRYLVLLGAAILAVTALGPALVLRGMTSALAAAPARAPGRRRDGGRLVAHPYVRRLLLTTLLAAAVSTFLDVTFRQVVAASLPVAALPTFFANFHLVTSAVALIVQLFGAGLLIRAVGVARFQIAFPILLAVGVALTVLTGGVAAVVLLRGLDGTLRSGFYRPAFELLQMPLEDRLRRKAKPLIDLLGVRGGQALAALALLVMFALASGPRALLTVTAGVLLLWTLLAFGVARRYVDLLRITLLERGVAFAGPTSLRLDGPARSALVAALGSGRDTEVLAGLDLLAAHGETRLVSPRLLTHPSAAVVRQALVNLPAQLPLPEGAPLLAAVDALQAHDDVGVRSAALRRRTAWSANRAALETAARDVRNGAVQGTALVLLVDRRWSDVAPAVTTLRALAAGGDVKVGRALAEAIAEHPSPLFEGVLLDLARHRDSAVLATVAPTLGTLASDATLTCLVDLLARREVRGAVRAALTHAGAPAFERVAAALKDPGQPLAVRASAARALAEIDPHRAAGVLVDGLLVEEDAFVRFRILRALNRIRRVCPAIPLDGDILGRAALAAAQSAYRYLAWRLYLEDGVVRSPQRRTPTWELLQALLSEKEENAIERLFRVLALRYPREDFRRLLRALRMGGRRTRAAGRELIENLLAGPARTLTLALIDDVSDRERLAVLTDGHPPAGVSTHEVLTAIRIEEEGGTLAALAAHHASELELQPQPAAPAAPAAGAHAHA